VNRSDSPAQPVPPIRAVRPAAALQTSMLLPALLGGRHQGVYVLQAVCRLPGGCDDTLMARALRRLAARHDLLSASFRREGPEFLLCLHEPVLPQMEVRDLSHSAPDAAASTLEAFLAADRQRGFDISRPPLHRLALLRLPGGEDALVWTVHHAVADGQGISLGLGQLLADYRALCAGHAPDASPAPAYGSFLDWLGRQDAEAAASFFRERFRGAADAPSLPAQPPRPGRGRGELRRSLHGLGPGLARLAEAAGGGLGAVLQAAWALVLARHTGERAVFFGAVRSLHHWSPEGAAMLGPCMNVIPRRVAVAPAEPLAHWLASLSSEWRAGREHAHLDTARQRDAAGGPPAPVRQDSVLTYSPASLQENLDASGLWPGARAFLAGSTPVPLGLSVTGRETLDLTLEHDLGRVDQAQAERLLDALGQTLAELAAARPDAAVGSIEVLPPRERERLVTAFGRNSATLSGSPDAYEILTAHAARQPDALALDGPAGAWTWARLMERSGRLARLFADQGVRPGDRVALCLPRTPWAVAAMVAALRAGACYVPLDPAYPAERIAYILHDSGAKLVLTGRGAPDGMRPDQALLELENLPPDPDGRVPPPAAPVPPETPAYLVYTSGTTGQPKGVVVPRRALSAYLRGSAGVYALRPDDRMLQFSSLSFDASVEEIHCALAAGATVVLRDDDCLASVAAFLDFLRQWRVTVLALPTSFWRLVVEGLAQHPLPPGVRQVIIGCESAPGSTLASWRKRVGGRIRLLNTYGPTETTVVATAADLTGQAEDGEPPIGFPLPSVRAYVCLPDMRLAPVGTPGELCLAGAQTALGYLNKPERTAEAFLSGPFAEIPEARLYRTGDLALWRDDGQLALIGRRDRQIKIRGFRVELSGVEAALAAEEGVVAAAVKDAGEGADKRLFAWAVLHDRSTDPARAAGLAARLAKRLPAYMRPARILLLEGMPLNAHGKVDYRSLEAPVEPDFPDTPAALPQAAGQTGALPDDDGLAARLADIWRRELRLDAVGPDDDFFQLGGDSLAALSTLARIEMELDTGLPAQALFTARTVRGLAALVRAVRQGGAAAGRTVLLDPIQPGGGRPPLFFVGANLLLPPLAEALGQDQPLWSLNIFGLQPPDGSVPDLDVPGIASRYIAEMKSISPSGPYYIAAYCMDAKIAYEMARQLHASKENVPFLGFLDGVWAPQSGARAVGRHLQNLRHFGPAYLRHKLRQKLRQWRIDARLALSRLQAGRTGAGRSSAVRNALFVDAFYRACDRYAPAPYEGPITLYLSWEWRAMRLCSLSELAAGDLAVREVPGFHDGWFDGEQVLELARLLREDMDRAGAGSG